MGGIHLSRLVSQVAAASCQRGILPGNSGTGPGSHHRSGPDSLGPDSSGPGRNERPLAHRLARPLHLHGFGYFMSLVAQGEGIKQ